VVGIEPTVLVDAAHNPHGATALTAALGSYFTFDEVAVVIGVLEDKDALGIVEALAPVATAFYVTQSQSERAVPAADLLETVREVTEEAEEFDSLAEALELARNWAAESEKRAVLVTGSITLVGEAIALAAAGKWKR
jgi:dihydrofolate synthase/folylpolyglutamate synthase